MGDQHGPTRPYKVTNIRVRIDVLVTPGLAEERAQRQRAIEAEYAREHPWNLLGEEVGPVPITTGEGAYLYVVDLLGEGVNGTFHVSSAEEWGDKPSVALVLRN